MVVGVLFMFVFSSACRNTLEIWMCRSDQRIQDREVLWLCHRSSKHQIEKAAAVKRHAFCCTEPTWSNALQSQGHISTVCVLSHNWRQICGWIFKSTKELCVSSVSAQHTCANMGFISLFFFLLVLFLTTLFLFGSQWSLSSIWDLMWAFVGSVPCTSAVLWRCPTLRTPPKFCPHREWTENPSLLSLIPYRLSYYMGFSEVQMREKRNQLLLFILFHFKKPKNTPQH